MAVSPGRTFVPNHFLVQNSPEWLNKRERNPLLMLPSASNGFRAAHVKELGAGSEAI